MAFWLIRLGEDVGEEWKFTLLCYVCSIQCEFDTKLYIPFTIKIATKTEKRQPILGSLVNSCMAGC